ncbi:glucokinase [Actinoalloteichus hoggarensis]|nr:glucokinase [Actinoalloteichus hoggarensis]
MGLDVGGTSVRAGVVDEHGTVLRLERTETPAEEQRLDDAVVNIVSDLVGEYEVAAVGLAVAGFVSEDRASVRFAPHLAWRHAPVAERISRRLGLPVVLEHDVNAAALAEHRFGAARGAGVAVLVAVGTGIGAALLIDGLLFRGSFGVAPELGHLVVVPEGRRCPCGKSGCWERYTSGTALASRARELLAERPETDSTLRVFAADPARLTGERVAEAARKGDEIALAALAEFAHWLGSGLALVSDVYDPEVIVLGGGVAASAELFLDRARDRHAEATTGAGFRPAARIRVAELGGVAGIVGAAQLAREHVEQTS